MSLFEKTRLYPWSRYRLWEIVYNIHYTTGKDSRGKNLDHKEAVIMNPPESLINILFES